MNKQAGILIFLVFISILSGCAAPPSEKLQLADALSGWKLAHKAQDRLTRSVRWELIPEGEYVSKWSRRYTVEFYDTKQTDLTAFMNGLRSELSKKCKSIEWRVLEQQAEAILYEWRSMGCRRFKERHELARLVRGTTGLHRVSYSEKKRQISAETYAEWQAKLRGAHLEAADK